MVGRYAHVTALSAITFSVVTMFGLAHCSSEEEPEEKKPTTSTTTGGGKVEQARQQFVKNVFPSVHATCASGCHNKGQRGAPIWLSDTADGSYTAIEGVNGYIAAPNQSPILNKGLHSGPSLTDQQQKLVQDWLTLEVNARGLSSDPSKPGSLREGFERFGKCMSYKRWMELKLNELCDTPTIGAGGTCKSCHIAGQSSLWLSPVAPETFLKFTQYPYVQKLVVGRVSKGGAFDGLEPSRRLLDKGTEARQPQANTHPQFTMTTEQDRAITTFVTETLANMENPQCQGDHPDPDAGTPPPQQN